MEDSLDNGTSQTEEQEHEAITMDVSPYVIFLLVGSRLVKNNLFFFSFSTMHLVMGVAETRSSYRPCASSLLTEHGGIALYKGNIFIISAMNFREN